MLDEGGGREDGSEEGGSGSHRGDRGLEQIDINFRGWMEPRIEKVLGLELGSGE